MINDYRFFQDFFDGQIVQPELTGYKYFKIFLISIVSAVGLFLTFMGITTKISLMILILGMVWNFYFKLDNKLSSVLAVVVGVLYFYVCCEYSLYANALIYVGVYIPLQLIANMKDYEDGDFVQIRKRLTVYNKILFLVFFVAVFMFLTLFSGQSKSNLWLFDSLSASLLTCSAVLRNERYFEYYIFRFFALIASMVLWIGVCLNFGVENALLKIMMYVSYLIFEIVTLIVSSKTYVNEYMLVVREHERAENDKLAAEKLKIYRNQK